MSGGDACPECGRREMRPAVVDAVVIRDGGLLLIKRGRDPERGAWALPGGYIDHDETAARACEREVLEETGLHVRIRDFLGVYDDPHRSVARTVSFAFLAEWVSGEARAGDDAAEAAWFPLDALPPLAFDHARIVPLPSLRASPARSDARSDA